MKPASVLVASLKVDLGRPPELPVVEDGLMTRARVKPDIQNVSLAFEGRAAALGTCLLWRNEF